MVRQACAALVVRLGRRGSDASIGTADNEWLRDGGRLHGSRSKEHSLQGDRTGGGGSDEAAQGGIHRGDVITRPL
jgi:hypothetical protein